MLSGWGSCCRPCAAPLTCSQQPAAALETSAEAGLVAAKGQVVRLTVPFRKHRSSQMSQPEMQPEVSHTTLTPTLPSTQRAWFSGRNAGACQVIDVHLFHPPRFPFFACSQVDLRDLTDLLGIFQSCDGSVLLRGLGLPRHHSIPLHLILHFREGVPQRAYSWY